MSFRELATYVYLLVTYWSPIGPIPQNLLRTLYEIANYGGLT